MCFYSSGCVDCCFHLVFAFALVLMCAFAASFVLAVAFTVAFMLACCVYV